MVDATTPTTPTPPADADGVHGPPPQPRRGNLAPIALALGIPGVLLGLVPFYGSFLALPLSVAALVLGLTARGRPEEHRGQATGGLVTGALGLLLVVGWIAWMGFNQLGFGSYASETAVEVGAGSESSVAVPAPDAEPSGEADDTVTVAPDVGEGGLRTGLSGEAEVAIGGQSVTMELADCAVSRASSQGVLVRASGPEGRLAVTRGGSFSAGLVVAVDTTDGPAGTYTGDERGMSGRGSSALLVERHRVTLEGSLRDVHDGQEVDALVEVTCS